MELPWPFQALAAFGGSAFWVGVLVTFIFTLIPGFMNALIIKRIVQKGPKAGLALAAANCVGGVAAVILGSLPFLFGITWLAVWLEANATTAMLIAGVLLLGFGGYMVFFTRPGSGVEKPFIRKWYVLGVFLYTALSPGNVLTDTALVTLLQTTGALQQPIDVVWLIFGFVVGCSLGWAVYLLAATFARSRMTKKFLRTLNIVLGLIITGAGLLMLGQALLTF